MHKHHTGVYQDWLIVFHALGSWTLIPGIVFASLASYQVYRYEKRRRKERDEPPKPKPHWC